MRLHTNVNKAKSWHIEGLGRGPTHIEYEMADTLNAKIVSRVTFYFVI